MEHIKQLKSIRDAARGRLENNPDYKMLTSLDNLIVELEGVSAIAELAEKSVNQEKLETSVKSGSTPKPETKPVQTLDQAFDTLNKAKKSNGAGNTVVDLSDEINGGAPLS